MAQDENAGISARQSGLLAAAVPDVRDWYAWNNLMPPKPDDFHLTGWVLVANPGVDPMLHFREPQGFNPMLLMLDLTLHQKPGIWTQNTVWKQVRYDEVPSRANYMAAEIYYDGASIAQVKVENIH